MRLHERQDRLTISSLFRMAKNAVMEVVNSDGSVSTIDLTELGVLDGLTATTAEINANCDASANFEVVTTTNVITASETGKHFVLNTATAFVSTLPAPALGLEFWFHIGTTAPTTSHTVVTNGGDNILEGVVSSGADGTAVVFAAASDSITFAANQAKTGDFVHLWSDGTTYFVDGQCKVAIGIVGAQA